MTILWIMYAVMAASLIAISVVALDRAAQLLRLPSRFLWLGGLVASVAVALVSLSWRGTPADAAAVAAFTLPAVVISAGAGTESLVAERVRVGSDSIVRAALLLWMGWTVVALAGIAMSVRRLARARREWTAASLNGVRVLIAPSIGPAAIGIMHREIVIPRWLLTMPAGDRELVLAHERAHLVARDPALRLGAALVSALMPWNPAVRWMENRLALAMERDCDARVLARPVDRGAYARLLVEIAARGSTPRLLAALSERTTHLERRITAMRHRHRPMPARAAGLAAAAIVLLAAAFTLPSPTTAAAVQELSGPGRVAAAASVTDTTYREFEVDTAVGPSRMTPPVYPAEQRLAGMNGEVIVEFVVDSRGALDPATVKVLRATHASFTAAVRTSLATASFKPAWKNGARVSQLVQMPFVFQLSTPK